MSFRNSNVQSDVRPETTGGSVGDMLDRNVCTTAAVSLGLASGGLGVGILLGAFPAQTLVVAGSVGALAYVGDRQHKDLPINPFEGKADDKSDAKSDVKSTVKSAEAAA